MKKIVLSCILSAVTSISIAMPIGIGFSTNNNSNVNQLAQCKEMTDTQINMLSQVNMQKEICLYENYARLTQRWTKEPPQPYVPPNSIIINMNKKEVSPEMKGKLLQTSQQCEDLAVKMRAKLKEMYGVDNFVCK